MSESTLAASLEAILFAAAEPVSLPLLKKVTGMTVADIKAALVELSEQLNGRGIQLIHQHGEYVLATNPAYGEIVQLFLGQTTRIDLTKPALETLAIVAYRGPITKSVIDGIRGVSSDQMIANLVSRGLIIEAGKADEPGKPVLYGVSLDFLQLLGIASLDELPHFDEIGQEAQHAA